MSNQDINDLPALKVNVPSFLMKTYEILENSSLSHIITWNQEGNAFIVLNSHELSSKVLANYFKHKNYPSFLRQLNMYSFKKTKNHYGQSEFRHQWFRRGLKSMLQYIRRRNQDDSENKIEIKNTNIQKIDNYKQEHDEMKKVVREIQTTQFQMEVDFSASMEQNVQATRSSQTILVQIKCNSNSIENLIVFPCSWLRLSHTSPIQVTSSKIYQAYQMGDLYKYSCEEPSPSRLEHSYIVPYNENNTQYSNVGSPYHQYSCNSPIHLLLSRQNQCNVQKQILEFQDYCFQFDPNLFQFNRSTQQQQQLALPAPALNSYLRIHKSITIEASNNYSLQSSSQNSPYRIASPIHSSSTDSKNPERFNFYQQA
ncbi:unnamed protein product (macronuclear) [Paramecium tetraurelia]|uniref:HSF-type DNA-binding domain-containing protein n=1 Tax=Paramecium tetraurelia TaxID=5888 RepID=A0CDG5_PARTE|nr:uncharacterized protein GSPATT00007043001 [Paramecium tetraurelia]CAK68832.1 unnamed protein product [Paramecium tetraurelia]|eukprot:XP_001436229.1 hypothetical protein (macronuclear) [Paramecium tetraurelia strain d4-2]